MAYNFPAAKSRLAPMAWIPGIAAAASAAPEKEMPPRWDFVLGFLGVKILVAWNRFSWRSRTGPEAPKIKLLVGGDGSRLDYFKNLAQTRHL